MHTLMVLGLTLATVLTAQDPVPPQASVAQPSPQQPVERRGLALADDPAVPARGWATRPDADGDGDLPGLVSTHGPGVRITAVSDVTVFRPAWNIAGEYIVSALFQHQASAAASTPYGFIVGGERGVAFLIRPDGGFAVQSVGAIRTTRSWSPVALRAARDGAPSLEHLEVRVGATDAGFLVNGQVVMTLPIVPGQLDGVPGVQVGAQGDLVVAKFGSPN